MLKASLLLIINSSILILRHGNFLKSCNPLIKSSDKMPKPGIYLFAVKQVFFEANDGRKVEKYLISHRIQKMT